ncbi:hypothetical protein, partial [Burkholderia pseudomallei]|uniref:hypothetical protein n=1 Tax=Burkholderia pseudomallei TaxID=28450 RepID=UPI001C3D0987
MREAAGARRAHRRRSLGRAQRLPPRAVIDGEWRIARGRMAGLRRACALSRFLDARPGFAARGHASSRIVGRLA